MERLLLPGQVDLLFAWRAGRAAKMAEAGLLPAIRLPDGQIRFKRSDLERFLEAAAIKPTEPRGVANA